MDEKWKQEHPEETEISSDLQENAPQDESLREQSVPSPSDAPADDSNISEQDSQQESTEDGCEPSPAETADDAVSDEGADSVTKPWEKFIPGDSMFREVPEEALGESGRTGEQPDPFAPREHTDSDASSPQKKTENPDDRRKYESKYDSYRFRNQENLFESSAKDDTAGSSNEDRRPMNRQMKNVLSGLALFAGLFAVVIGIAYGTAAVRGRGGNASGTEENSGEIVLGKQGQNDPGTEEYADAAVSAAEETVSYAEEDVYTAAAAEDSAAEHASDMPAESADEADSTVSGEASADSGFSDEDAVSEQSGSASTESGTESTELPADVRTETEDEDVESSGNGTVVFAAADETEGTVLTVPEIAARAENSMVAVQGDSVGGSGIAVAQTDDSLLILTASTIVSGAENAEITFGDGSSAEGAVIAESSETGISIVAVDPLKLTETAAEALTLLPLGDHEIAVGEDVVAVGFAKGYGLNVASGMLLSSQREVTDSDESVHVMLETSASVHEGNIGGALFSTQGDLLGIIVSDQGDTGFAVSSAEASELLEGLGVHSDESAEESAETGADRGGYLGVKVVTIQSTDAGPSIQGGVYVSGVSEGGPADMGGVEVGDIITAVDENSVSGSDHLVSLLADYSAGDTVVLTVLRSSDGLEFEQYELSVVLGSRSAALGTDAASEAQGDDEESGEEISLGEGSQNGNLEGYYGGLFGDDDQ